MKAVKKTGLVPVKVGDDIFGVRPADAIKGLLANEFELADIPEGIETIDVEGYPVVTDDPVEAPVVDEVIEIPEDWATLHYLKQIALAKAILGVEALPEKGDLKPTQIAVEAIEAELLRRATESAGSPAA